MGGRDVCETDDGDTARKCGDNEAGLFASWCKLTQLSSLRSSSPALLGDRVLDRDA